MNGAHEAAEGRILPSGVPGFDQVLGGGIPRGDPMFIIGPPSSAHGSSTIVAAGCGTGKTLMALQYLRTGGRLGKPALFVGLREPPSSCCAPTTAQAACTRSTRSGRILPPAESPDQLLAEIVNRTSGQRAGCTRSRPPSLSQERE